MSKVKGASPSSPVEIPHPRFPKPPIADIEEAAKRIAQVLSLTGRADGDERILPWIAACCDGAKVEHGLHRERWDAAEWAAKMLHEAGLVTAVVSPNVSPEALAKGWVGLSMRSTPDLFVRWRAGSFFDRKPVMTKDSTIWYHGERSYSSDAKNPVCVSAEIHNVLKEFMETRCSLATEALPVANVSRVVRKIIDKFGNGAVRTPSEKGDGYFIRVEPIETIR